MKFYVEKEIKMIIQKRLKHHFQQENIQYEAQTRRLESQNGDSFAQN